jgi:hypothetical protein
VAAGGLRDLGSRPYERWEDLLDGLADLARDEPLLLIIDEFPELLPMSPALPAILRAFLDRSRGRTRLRILICGSSVRLMEAIQDYREPLYGRFDESILLHPFRPHEAASMLPGLSSADRALVYGIVGGMPQYLQWWRQDRTTRQNLQSLACRPGALLLTEGERVLGTEHGSASVRGLRSRDCHQSPPGRTRNHGGGHLRARDLTHPVVTASASGRTAGAPASRSRIAATVIVQPVSI